VVTIVGSGWSPVDCDDRYFCLSVDALSHSPSGREMKSVRFLQLFSCLLFCSFSVDQRTRFKY